MTVCLYAYLFLDFYVNKLLVCEYFYPLIYVLLRYACFEAGNYIYDRMMRYPSDPLLSIRVQLKKFRIFLTD